MDDLREVINALLAQDEMRDEAEVEAWRESWSEPSVELYLLVLHPFHAHTIETVTDTVFTTSSFDLPSVRASSYNCFVRSIKGDLLFASQSSLSTSIAEASSASPGKVTWDLV